MCIKTQSRRTAGVRFIPFTTSDPSNRQNTRRCLFTHFSLLIHLFPLCFWKCIFLARTHDMTLLMLDVCFSVPIYTLVSRLLNRKPRLRCFNALLNAICTLFYSIDLEFKVYRAATLEIIFASIDAFSPKPETSLGHFIHTTCRFVMNDSHIFQGL